MQGKRDSVALAAPLSALTDSPVAYPMRDLASPDEREDKAEYIATRVLQGW